MKPARGFTPWENISLSALFRPERASPTGFIALISAIIISTVLLAVAATLDQGVFFARFDGLNGEYHAIAAHLADGCIETALLKLRDDYDYTVEHDNAYDPAQGGVPIAEGTLYGTEVACLLLGPTTTPTEVAHTRSFTVTARATFNNAFSTQQVTATVFNPHYSQGMVPIVSMSGLHEIP